MKPRWIICIFKQKKRLSSLIISILMLPLTAAGIDVKLELLKTRTAVYTNVTVYGKSATDIFLRHSRGLTNVKIKDLDNEVLQTLGFSAVSPAGSKHSEVAQAKTNTVKENVESAKGTNAIATVASQDLVRQLKEKVLPNLTSLLAKSHVPISSNFLIGLLIGVLTGYLFFCYCLKRICEKAGQEAGIMVWLPILQMFPMLRAAGMSGWWFLAFLIPFLNLVAQIMWSIKIVEALQKSKWFILFLLLPGTNILAFIYLAFSSSGGSEEQVISEGPPVIADA